MNPEQIQLALSGGMMICAVMIPVVILRSVISKRNLLALAAAFAFLGGWFYYSKQGASSALRNVMMVGVILCLVIDLVVRSKGPSHEVTP